MRTLTITITLMLLLALTACGSSPSTGEPTPDTPASNSLLTNLFHQTGNNGTMEFRDEGTPTVEETLEKGLLTAQASPTHLVFRGTTSPDSTRCEWRGTARTPQQRESAIRFWLNLDQEQPLPNATVTEQRLIAEIERVNPAFPATLKANVLTLAKGGLSTEYQFLTCYVDYDISEFIVGTTLDSSTISVAYDRLGEERSYEVYQTAHEAGEFEDQNLLSKDEYLTHLANLARAAEITLEASLANRESVVFLAPMGAHNAIAVEAWQAVAQWDVQTNEQQGNTALRYGAARNDPEYSQPLTSLRSRINAAAASDDYAGTRITNVSGLNQYYRDIGAYDDITPGDGSDATFMPAMPPPVPTCTGSTAVGTDPDQGLVDDCNALLDLKETLAGTATLNWSKDAAMSSWDGIRLGGSPQRVQFLLLTDKDLDGSIPALLGNLTELRRIDLDVNSLTGEIPAQLGSLKKLTHLYLFENELSGELPPELGQMTALQILYPEDNDLTGEVPEEIGDLSNLTQLVLADNELSGPLPDSLGNLSNLGHLRLRDNNFTGQIPRTLSALDIQYLGLSGNAFTGCLPTDLETGGNDDLWRPELTALPTCAPSFSEAEYAFTLPATEPAGAAVGSVTAAPYETGDDVSYAVTAGNEGGLFQVDSGTGSITLARAKTAGDQDTRTLTVEARDSHEQVAIVTVSVTLTTE